MKLYLLLSLFIIGIDSEKPVCQYKIICTYKNNVNLIENIHPLENIFNNRLKRHPLENIFNNRLKKHVDSCKFNQCKNGICIQIKNGYYKCSCNPGYKGKHCDILTKILI